MSAEHYLFVYGTLRCGSGGPMSRWLAARARLIGRATLPGRLYDLGDYPAFYPVHAAKPVVYGDLYALPNRQSLLRKLDQFEGIGTGQGRPYEYRRERLSVTLENGERCEAWVYVYARTLSGRRRIAGGNYLTWRRQRGKRHAGFSPGGEQNAR